jgi:hypothetical protein
MKGSASMGVEIGSGNGAQNFENPAASSVADVEEESAAGGTPAGTSGSPRPSLKSTLSWALFGSANGHGTGESEREEDLRLRMQWFGLLHPDTTVHTAYDMFQLVVMIYLAWQLPLRFAFTRSPGGTMEILMDWFIDLTVWVDMFLQMRMFTYDPLSGHLVTDRSKLKRAYRLRGIVMAAGILN